jgi:putative transposase
MKAAEFREGLADLNITHAMTLPYSAYQNAKAESFWNQAEGRFFPMLEGCRDLTLAQLNEAFQAFVELDYNRGLHGEIGTTPLERFLSDKNVGRPSPDSDAVRRAFRMRVARQQRRSDGTVSIAGQRFEVPSRYRHQKTIHVRYSRWALRYVDMIDIRTDTVLCRLFPIDKAQNADGRRRVLQPLPEDESGPVEPPPSGMAPLLRELMAEYSATGIPPAYLPKGEIRADGTREAEDDK